MKVYVIMQGEYSDKHICGVAIDPGVAELIRQKCSDPDVDYDYGQARIEEYETNEWSPIVKGGALYRVDFLKNGNVECSKTEISHYDYQNYPLYSKIFKTHNGLSVYVIALGQAHAKKIACDKRAEYLAMKEGI